MTNKFSKNKRLFIKNNRKGNNLFYLKDTAISYVIDWKDNIWFNGKDISLFFGYNRCTNILKQNVEKQNMRKLKKIFKINEDTSIYDHGYSFKELNIKYINEDGLYIWMSKCEIPDIKSLCRELFEKIIPSITAKLPSILNNKMDPCNEFELPIIKKQNYINNKIILFNKNMIKLLKNENVIYIAIIDNQLNDNNQLYMFGESSGTLEYDNDHNKNIFLNFRIIYIIKYQNMLETIKNEFNKRNILRSIIIDNIKYDNIFILTERYNMNTIITILNTLINMKELKENQNKYALPNIIRRV